MSANRLREMTPRRVDGLMVAGAAVILTGPAIESALQAVLIAIRSRRANGLPMLPAYYMLVTALGQARSAGGLSEVREPVGIRHFSYQVPTVPIAEAAERLGVCERQVRRLAPRLGGRKIGGRWFVDEQMVADHIEERRSDDRTTVEDSCG